MSARNQFLKELLAVVVSGEATTTGIKSNAPASSLVLRQNWSNTSSLRTTVVAMEEDKDALRDVGVPIFRNLQSGTGFPAPLSP